MIFGTHDDNTLEQFADVSERADRSALMADGHLGYIMPVGGVAAYRDKVSVSGVGFDIACGNCAVRLDETLEDIADLVPEIADTISEEVAFGLGKANEADDAPVDDPLFRDDRWSLVPADVREPLREKARRQLGSVGSGNHYVDVFHDEMGYLWIGVHFGSRALGHTIASNFLALAAGKEWGERVQEFEALIAADTPLGHAYVELMKLAGEYAHAGREWVCDKVTRILGGTEVDRVHNNHNFAWREQHFGEWYWVVRKGATPAFPGQRGFVGGSMGDQSVILRGIEDPHPMVESLQRDALYSTVHGSGRVMSRTEARGKINWKTKEVKRPGRVTAEMMEEATRGVERRGGGLDEAPQVYRRLSGVLEAQHGTVEVLHRLTPVIVVMAGEGL